MTTWNSGGIINGSAVKVGDEFETLAQIGLIFSARPEISRIQVERRAAGWYAITVMDDQRPNDLRHISKLGGGDYEIHRNRDYESIRAYHVPTDMMRYVFYRLQPGA